METIEMANYTRFLAESKAKNLKQNTRTVLWLSLFIMTIYLSYAYAFFIGSVFVERRVHNDVFDRQYMGGDTIAIFFAVITGLFQVTLLSNQFKGIVEGRVAAKFVFEVIDRVPAIPTEDPSAEKHTLQGEIELRNVSFYYPSRPDIKVLQNFSAKFEVGKTTAIVGCSGAGKSSITQLVERFYDPEEGQVLVDGKDIKSLNLAHYRKQIGYVPQEPVLFNTSIKKNVKMGKPDASVADVREALEMS